MGGKKKSGKTANDAFDLLKFIWKRKWMLITISFLACIIAVVVSFRIPPKFESKIILFPTAAVSVSDNLTETALVADNSSNILTFGKETDAETMLQILSSGKLKDYIISKHNLAVHYGIDMNSRYPNTQLTDAYYGNISFRRTKYNSIEIAVLDMDAQTAADVANDIAGYIDSIFYQVQFDRASEAFQIAEKEYQASQQEVERLNVELQHIRAKGVLDYESQVAALSEAYANAVVANNARALSEINNKLDILSRYGGTYIELSKKLENEIDRLSQLKNKYISYKINIEQAIPRVYILDRAEKSEKKAVPKRSMIVVIATLSTFGLALLLLLGLDYLKVLK